MASTHTYATLEVSGAAYDEIRKKLEDAGYQHAFHDAGLIDMNGIAIERPAGTLIPEPLASKLLAKLKEGRPFRLSELDSKNICAVCGKFCPDNAERCFCGATLEQRLKLERDHLAEFKAYVHKRLDEAGVPADPEPAENAKHGCRIEGRLNQVLGPPKRVAPAGGFVGKCPRCTRVPRIEVAAGEVIGNCAQCWLGEGVRVAFVPIDDAPLAPGLGVTDRG